MDSVNLAELLICLAVLSISAVLVVNGDLGISDWTSLVMLILGYWFGNLRGLRKVSKGSA